MEEIKWKLSGAGEGSAEVLSSSVKLLDAVIQKSKADKSETELSELRLVWDQLGSDNVLTAQACCDILVELVTRGHLDVGVTLTGLLASISHGKNVHGIVPAIGRILAHQVMLNMQVNVIRFNV